MDAPSLQGYVTLLASRRRLQTYIRPSDARSASALMECAGWLLNKTASSKLVISVRFDQPRSYLYCHQRSISLATCVKVLLQCALSVARCASYAAFGTCIGS